MGDEGKGNSPWASLASAGITAIGNAITRGGPKRQYKYNKKMMAEQNRLNRENAEWAFNKELELRKFQMDYDTPQAQMQRLKDAGLNPNLIYGSGSAAAGSFEAPSAPNVPGVSSHSIDAAVLGNLGTEFQQARLMAAQTDLTQMRTEESTVKQDLMKAQKDVTKANPYLKEGYVDSLVAQLKATADLKKQEASFMLEQVTGKVNGKDVDVPGVARGYVIMQEQMRQLFNKFQLQEADLKIKAQILESKEFQNALSEIQVQWMRDGDITPQHIFQAIFMLLNAAK